MNRRRYVIIGLVIWVAGLVTIGFAGLSLANASGHPVPAVTVTKAVPAPTVTKTVYRTKVITRTVTVPEVTPAPAALPPFPHINGATHSELVNCLQAQCTTLPGAGPYGGTCGAVVGNEQECVW